MSGLDAAEMISVPFDRHREGIPRESLSRSNGNPPRPPALWSHCEVLSSPEPCYGRYPKGFLAWALKDAGVRGDRVLHVCSGGMSRAESMQGTRVDIRPAAVPDVIADGRALPFRDDAFEAVFLDPPYAVEYAQSFYGVEYPRPSHLLKEACRVVQPGGVIGILHYLIPMPPVGAKLVRVVGITQGLGYRIRAWTLYRKEQRGLFQ